jgi:CBS-domain-containing membrane protein
MSEDTGSGKPLPEDYARALQSMNTFIDVEVRDLMLLAERAQHFARQRAAETLPASRIMSSPVVVVHPHTRMSEAAHLLVSKRISGLPVTDADDRLVGMITEADFLRGLGLPTHPPSQSLWQTLEAWFHHLDRQGDVEGPDDPVADHMAREVVCVPPDRDVHELLALMRQHCVQRIPVCNDQRQVLGMVTRSDLVRILYARYLQADERK